MSSRIQPSLLLLDHPLSSVLGVNRWESMKTTVYLYPLILRGWGKDCWEIERGRGRTRLIDDRWWFITKEFFFQSFILPFRRADGIDSLGSSRFGYRRSLWNSSGEIKFDDFAKNKNIWEKKRKSNSTVISLRNYKFKERSEREREWYFPSTTSRIIHLQLSPSLNNVWLSSFLRHLPPSFRFIQILS